ncbi:MAG: hypothetical protein Q9227_006338 [Pyrenula ochraceoflavens]
MISRRLAPLSPRCQPKRVFPHLRQTRRQLSSTAPSPPARDLGPGLTSTFSTLLDRISPRFDIDASDVEILDGPSAFYETLKSKISAAKRRVFLSTLYIGRTEHELILTLDNALLRNPALKVSILTDALRGTRESPDPSSASLLSELVAKHGSERVEVRMFHTPNLTGLRKWLIPRRINEGWGLQHMKLYGFDDEIILSGANLSQDYFTNRLDRYHLFSVKDLTDFYERIHQAICSISFQVLPDMHNTSGYLLDWPSSNGCPSPLEDPRSFKRHSRQILQPLVANPDASRHIVTVDRELSSSRTLVYPLIQVTPFAENAKPSHPSDISTEFRAMKALFALLNKPEVPSSWLFTAGYFNIHPELSSSLISSALRPPYQVTESTILPMQKNTVLTASPWANGFYGSAGISGMLPDAYTQLSRRFLDKIFRAGGSDRVQLKEWRRGTVGQPGGWTYHAKGIWATFARLDAKGTSNGEDVGPSITVVGSSNYTKRSYSLDLEVGAMVVTDNEVLKRKLKDEAEWLQKDATVVTRDDLTKVERRVSWKVRLAMRIVELVGGAL